MPEGPCPGRCPGLGPGPRLFKSLGFPLRRKTEDDVSHDPAFNVDESPVVFDFTFPALVSVELSLNDTQSESDE